jgi:hypothetical protein
MFDDTEKDAGGKKKRFSIRKKLSLKKLFVKTSREKGELREAGKLHSV